MRSVCILLIGILSGCAPDSPCDYRAKSVPCDASIDPETGTGALMLVGPACSETTVSLSIDNGRETRVPFANITGRLKIATTNQMASVVPGSCRAFPPREK